jgi:AraC-like DNA-binding protein
VLAGYIVVFLGVYGLLYMILSYFRADYYQPDSWTIKKELQMLLFYIPTTACCTYLFADFSVQGFELSISTFFELQFYNGILGIISIPLFGYFVDNRLNPINTARRRARKNKDSALNTTEQQARDVLQKLHDVMETHQLYLSRKCTKHYVSEHTGIAAHRISATINTYTDGTFTDFVNNYRVEHACRILQDNKHKRVKLEAVRIDCGFGSKVNFYTAFRKFKGTTPAEYLTGL